ncbi:MAG: glycosyltransferase family 9 protein [bacterium]|nr:glycosyltransferase family 9 protein [bacterium]
MCDPCPHWDPIQTRILIIKLGATGDVLRTTDLLGALQRRYPGAHISWICGTGSFELIQHLKAVDRPYAFTAESLVMLDQQEFDLCVNFDLAPEAAALASRIRASQKKGFGMHPDGSIYPFHPEAEEWFEMSMWDDLKKANTRTYQSHMRQILGLPDVNHTIHTPLRPHDQQQAKAFAHEYGLDGAAPILGFNVGAGDRWQHKKWTVDGFAELARRAFHELHARIVVFYGPVDATRAREVMAALPVPYVDAGLHPSLLEFFAYLNLCDLVLTGDTFALHAALGLGKKVVCFVGPTSAAELELYGLGVVLQGKIDCLGCYLTTCDKKPHCMEMLDVDTVYAAVKNGLGNPS